jgi:asparagine synthase (glutamine-hydrolysing)
MAADRGLEADDGVLRAWRGLGASRPVHYAVGPAEPRASFELVPMARGRALEPDHLGRRISAAFDANDVESGFVGVRRLRPGQSLRVDEKGRLRLSGPELPAADERAPSSTTAAAAELRREILAAVERAAAGRRVAVAVSGGLDSSALLAACVELVRDGRIPSVVAVNLGFEGEGDDRPHLRALLRHLGVEAAHVAPEDAGPSLRELLVVDATPTLYPGTALEVAMLRRARALGADVLLTGLGGDEILGGFVAEYASHARRAGVLRAALRASRAVVPWPSSRRERVRGVLGGFLRPYLPRALLRARARRQWRLPWAGPRLRALLARIEAPDGATDRADQRLRHHTLGPFVPEVGELVARTELASGMARAEPLLDPLLVEHVARLPPLALWHGDQHRGLFREAMRGWVPESLRMRPDKAWFDRAFAAALGAAGGFPAFAELASFEGLADLGLVEPRPARVVLAPIEHGDTRPDADIDWMTGWALLSAEAFVRTWGRP